MSKTNNTLQLQRFFLTSSTEVTEVIEKVTKFYSSTRLFHISSYIHNTVLVQNLKRELEKSFPDAKVVLLNHDDKNTTLLSVYNTELEETEDVSDLILDRMYQKYERSQATIEEYRNQLFLRYFTDHLTNLPNLYQLRKDLQNDDEESTLIILKIDNFQTINNFYGFVVGDYVVEYISTYIKENIMPSSLYRLSGTEFAIRLGDTYDFYRLKDYLNKLYKQLQNMLINYQNLNIFVNFTLSSSVSKDNENLFSKVSMALKYAEDNSLPFWIYEDSMNFENEYEKNLELSQQVRAAIHKNMVIPYYQAIYNYNTGTVNKYESLARLVDADGNVLSPQVFIPIAKSLKLYNRVTEIVVEKTFAAFEDTDAEVSINLSIEDIMNNEVFQFIIDKLKAFKEPWRITFELLESEAILDFKKVERFINEVKRRGAKVAIDDFGSGYSNFAHILSLHVDYIKIDGSLVEKITTDKTSLIAVETIVDFAKKLGIKTVAEYVYSSTVFVQIQKMGVDYAQGFYIDQPSISLSKVVPT